MEMEAVLVAMAAVVILVGLAICLPRREKGWVGEVVCLSVLAMFSLGLLALWAAPKLGYGHVSDRVAPISEQLQKGVQYQITGSDKDRGNYVLTVKRTGCVADDCYRVIRVTLDDAPSYETFMIGDDGKAVADGMPTIGWSYDKQQ